MNLDPTAAPNRSPSVQLDPSVSPPVILLGADTSWIELREDARRVLEPVSAAWAGAEAHLDLGQREPDLFDLRRLVHMLKDDFDINVIGLRCLDVSLRRFAERELKVRIHLHSPQPPPAAGGDEPSTDEPSEELPMEPSAEINPDTSSEPVGLTGSPVHIVQRTLRGGTVLRHSGDLLLYGDVKPGAEIIAGGSITVLGTMMGMAHAGTRSGERGWILATTMGPSQLRIGQRISISEPSRDSDARADGPTIAFVRDGDIVIESYRGRLPRNATRRSDA